MRQATKEKIQLELIKSLINALNHSAILENTTFIKYLQFSGTILAT